MHEPAPWQGGGLLQPPGQLLQTPPPLQVPPSSHGVPDAAGPYMQLTLFWQLPGTTKQSPGGVVHPSPHGLQLPLESQRPPVQGVSSGSCEYWHMVPMQVPPK